MTFLANRNSRANDRASFDSCSFANAGYLFNHHAGTDADVLAKFNMRADHCRGMDASWGMRKGEQFFSSCKPQARLIGFDYSHVPPWAGACTTGLENYCRCAAAQGFGRRCLILGKDQVP